MTPTQLGSDNPTVVAVSPGPQRGGVVKNPKFSHKQGVLDGVGAGGRGGEALGVTVGDASGVGVTEGETVMEGVTVGVTVIVGVIVGVGVSVGVTVGVGVVVGVGVLVGVTVTVGVGLGVGVGSGEAHSGMPGRLTGFVTLKRLPGLMTKGTLAAAASARVCIFKMCSFCGIRFPLVLPHLRNR